MNTKPTATLFQKKLKKQVSITNNLRYLIDNILKKYLTQKK